MNIKIIRGNELSEHNVIEALNIDKVVYPEEYVVTEEQSLSYFRKNKKIYVMALDEDTNKIVGYVNASPLSDSAYNHMFLGSESDVFLQGDDVLEYKPNCFYKVYISSIVVHPDYQGKGISNMIIDGLLKTFSELKEDNTIVVRLLADVISDGGERVAKKLGMKYLWDSKHNSKIYEKSMDD